MKKSLFIVVVIVFGMLNVDAQEAQYGVTVGFLNVNGKAEYLGQSATASESGCAAGRLNGHGQRSGSQGCR